MSHTRLQEEADIVRCFGCATHRVQHAVVVFDGIQRSHIRIRPAVIHQQFSIVRKELLKVWVCRVHHVIFRLLGPLDAFVKVEGAPIPLGIFVYDVLVVIEDVGGRIRTGSLYAPAQFGSGN